MILIFMLVCTFIGYLIGNSKGQPLSGAFVSFLFGPLGWLIALFSSDQRPKCPACKGAVHEGATKCVNCGSDLPDEKVKDVAIDASIESKSDDETFIKTFLFVSAAVLCVALIIGSMQ